MGCSGSTTVRAVAWFRRSGVPPEVDEQVGREPGERILAAAPATAGWVVATSHALWVPGDSGMVRLGWESVDSASWDRDEEVLTVVQAAPVDGRPRRWLLRMPDAGELLLVVKEQVRATVVTSRWVPVVGDRGVTIVARRPPGTDRLAWTVSVDAGLVMDEPTTRARVDEALAMLRSELGR